MQESRKTATPRRASVRSANHGGRGAGNAHGALHSGHGPDEQTMDQSTTQVTLTGTVRLVSPWGSASAQDLGGRQPRLVFAYLTMHLGTPVTHEVLARHLWPEGAPTTWPAALRGLVTRVRRFLQQAGIDDDGALAGATGCYVLQLPPPTVVDVELAARAAILGEGSRSDAEQARTHLLTALDVSSREFLPGVTGPWVDDQREALRATRLRALRVMAQIHLDQGDHDRALRAARDAMRLAPSREETWRLLIRVLDASGERAEALRTYEQCRAALADELGIDPSPPTTELYLQLLGGHHRP